MLDRTTKYWLITLVLAACIINLAMFTHKYPVLWPVFIIVTMAAAWYDFSQPAEPIDVDKVHWGLISLVVLGSVFVLLTLALDLSQEFNTVLSIYMIGNFASQIKNVYRARKTQERPTAPPQQEETPSEDDHYKVFRLRTDATWVEIKEQYKRLAAKFHPDRHQDGDEFERELAAYQMSRINRAYEYLKRKYGVRE